MPVCVATVTQMFLPFIGGAELQLASLLRRLHNCGVEATVFARRHVDRSAVGCDRGHAGGHCFTNRVRDSSHESSVVAGLHEQTDSSDLQDPELAELQRSAQALWVADGLVRSRYDLGGAAHRQARPPARLLRCPSRPA